MKFFSLLCFSGILFFASCTTQKGTTNNYMEMISDTSGKNLMSNRPPLIQKGDLLSIKVYSKANGIDLKADAPYNLPEQGTGGSTAGFLVDQGGDIEYPQLGVLHVEGMTREQLAESIKAKLEPELTQPSVVVRFLNYKVTVLGEVHSPGTYTFPTENVTILEAIGLSGDITEFGKKNNVKVVRENNGQIERGIIDLTSDSMFISPFYHLQQGDVVFVEQTRKKLKQQDQQTLVQQIGIATSIITAIALILNFIK
jgi:polysaccharide export outer membrane protein